MVTFPLSMRRCTGVKSSLREEPRSVVVGVEGAVRVRGVQSGQSPIDARAGGAVRGERRTNE